MYETGWHNASATSIELENSISFIHNLPPIYDALMERAHLYYFTFLYKVIVSIILWAHAKVQSMMKMKI